VEALRTRWWPPSESAGKKAREAAAERGLQLLKKARPSSCQRRGCWPPLAVEALRDEMALAEEALAVATSSKSVQVSVPVEGEHVCDEAVERRVDDRVQDEQR